VSRVWGSVRRFAGWCVAVKLPYHICDASGQCCDARKDAVLGEVQVGTILAFFSTMDFWDVENMEPPLFTMLAFQRGILLSDYI
jgi:hypothetical protein